MILSTIINIKLTATRVALIALSIVLTSGCATIVKGTTQGVSISSDPPGADVNVDGAFVGQTPLSVEMERKRDHLVTIERSGYESRTVPVVKSVGGAVWGNVLAGGLIGWGVDATSGAQYDLSPATISVRLIESDSNEAQETQQNNDNASAISRLNELDDMLENRQISEEEYSRLRLAILEEYYVEDDP